MKLYIPACGDRLTLIADWIFTLHLEHRNCKFAEELGLIKKGSGGGAGIEEDDPRASGSRYGLRYKRVSVTLPKDTQLEVERVYIRNFNKSAMDDEDDFDSITWRVVGKKKQRFWAKLVDCNRIEFKLENKYRDRVKAEKLEAQQGLL